MSLDAFYKQITPVIRRKVAGTGIFPQTVLAQLTRESVVGNRLSTLAAKHNNYFGVKATKSWKGKTVTLPTWEERNGQAVKEPATFRAYGSFSESLDDYIRILQRGYASALKATDYKAQMKAIAARYATDGNYYQHLLKSLQRAKKYLKTGLPVGGLLILLYYVTKKRKNHYKSV